MVKYTAKNIKQARRIAKGQDLLVSSVGLVKSKGYGANGKESLYEADRKSSFYRKRR